MMALENNETVLASTSKRGKTNLILFKGKSKPDSFLVTRKRRLPLNEVVDAFKKLHPGELENYIQTVGIDNIDLKGKFFEYEDGIDKKEYLDTFIGKIRKQDLASYMSGDIADFLAKTSNIDTDTFNLEIVTEKTPLMEVYPFDFVAKGNTYLKYDSIKYQKLMLAWHKTIEYIIYYNRINGNSLSLSQYTIGFTFDDDKASYVRIDNDRYLLLNPSDISFQDLQWRGVVIELINRACHLITEEYYDVTDDEFYEFESNIRMVSLWYLTEFSGTVGAIIRSKKDSLVENAKLNEEYVYEEEISEEEVNDEVIEGQVSPELKVVDEVKVDSATIQ